jgi:protein TorT
MQFKGVYSGGSSTTPWSTHMKFENEAHLIYKSPIYDPRQSMCRYCLFGLVCVFGLGFGLTVTTVAEASSTSSWATTVGIYNPACTNGELRCWAEATNHVDQLEQVVYQSLDASMVQKKHHICVSFPHLKDSYWAGVAFGIISEAKRLNQKITILEAGGYTNLETQLNQVDDCIANGADALIIGPISSHGNAKQIDLIRAQGIPVIVIITGINTVVDANSLQSFATMGFTTCQWIALQHQQDQEKVKIIWFPGPPSAGWSISADQGCRQALLGTQVEILDTKWGDTGKAIQLKLVEAAMQTHVLADQPEFDYIVGTATSIEGAVGALRSRKLDKEVKLVAYYYTPGMDMFIRRGQVAMAPSDQMIIQARVSVDQAVRLLEGLPMATGGRPEFGQTGRLTEHVQPPIIIVTPENIDNFESHTTLAPKYWSPVFSVD